MAGSTARIDQAAALHRQAEATVRAAAVELERQRPATVDPPEQRHLAAELQAAAEALTPGWLGVPLDAAAMRTPLGEAYPPQFVRLGTAHPAHDAQFPVVVPLLGNGHLALDVDARDVRVAGLLRAMLLRLLASAPAGSLLIRAVDGTGGGAAFAPFAALQDAGLMSPPAVDHAGLRDVLGEAERWLRPARAGGHRRGGRDRLLLVVIATLPEPADLGVFGRIAALAQQGPQSGLHLIVAGWPSPGTDARTDSQPLNSTDPRGDRLPPDTADHRPGRRPPDSTDPGAGWRPSDSTDPGRGLRLVDGDDSRPARMGLGEHGQPPLANTTSVSLAGDRLTIRSPQKDTWLDAPVMIDEDPPLDLIDTVCRQLAAQSAVASQVTLADLLPSPDEPVWSTSAAEGLVTIVGHDGDNPVQLYFNDLAPHWMVGGRSGAGKTAFLINVLYGLGARYSPDELALYLLDFKEGVSFAEFVPTQRDRTWLPHARAVGVESDREYGLAVLRELDAEMTRRSVAYKRAGVTRFADLRALPPEEGRRRPMPRVLCMIDEFQVLLAGNDPMATEAVQVLESLARKGRSYGIHLILASQTVLGVEALYAKRDSIFGQFPVRIALPGGGDVLEPTNDSAAGLPLGTAVVNTAGGLGGPRGATRGHERIVRFPDPHADRNALSDLRHRLWAARDPEAMPPRIFAGYAHQHLADDPTYRAALAGRVSRPAALVGRVIDVNLSTAAFPLDASPGRHLAIFGSSAAGAEVLEAAARSVAACHAPRTARFVISPLVAEGDELAKELAAEIGHRQEVVVVGAAGLAAELAQEGPGYLVVFGMDAAAPGTLTGLRQLLREGPSRGVHLLSWWRGLRRFAEETGGSAGREDMAGLVFLNVPQTDVTVLLGRPVDWHPRDNRALLHDRQADRSVTIVPFVRPEETV